MWTAILPIILPALINIISYAAQKKLLSDAQVKTFIDFVQAMSVSGGNNSKIAHQKFLKMHEKLQAMKK
jgi:hypothetical protein